MTFWEHLDELRGSMVRILAAIGVATVAAFCCKEALFSALLWPQAPDFPANALMAAVTGVPFRAHLVNIDLAQQFLTHVKASLWAGLLLAMPYVLYVLFRFVAPALHGGERRHAVRAVLAGYALFLMGVALAYFVVFPVTFRFLAGYQVSAVVRNAVSLASYMSVLLTLCLALGAAFEVPVLCWLLAKMGVLSAAAMRRRRRHAIVVVVVAAAVVTPTGDPFTLAVVSLPLYLLFEASVAVAARAQRQENP